MAPVKRQGHAQELVLSVYREHGVIPKASRDDNHNRTPDNLDTYQLVEPGDVVFNKMKAWSGSVGVSRHRGIVSPDYMVCQVLSPDIDQRFLHYLLRSHALFSEYRRRSKGIRPSQWRLYFDELRSVELPLPPLDTQRRIADVLDAETARIDTLIEKNERVIQLVWLRYRVLRRELLAGGLLLGSPGAHSWAESRGWRVAPLWLLSVNHDSRRIPLNAEERGLRQGPFPYWGANSIQDHIDGWLFDGPHVLIGEDGAPYFIEERDVAWVADGRYWVNNHAHVIEAVDVEPWWLAECLNVVDYSLFITGSTRDKLTQENLNRIPIPVPEPGEQARVLNNLGHARELAATLADRCRRQQELLRLRRQSLITAAVTGQIEV